jgi:hypothetical protein
LIDVLSERRGRTLVRPATIGAPSAPPGLPPPLTISLPLGLIHSSDTATNSSGSSDQDHLEIQTAAALRADDDYRAPDVVSQCLDVVPAVHSHNPLPSGVSDSLWDDPREREDDPLLCRVHGLVCSKGICSQYSRQLKEQKPKRDNHKQEGRTASRGRGSRGGAPFNNRGRNGGELRLVTECSYSETRGTHRSGGAWSNPASDRKRSARSGRGAADQVESKHHDGINANEHVTAESSGGEDTEEAGGLDSATTEEESNAWEAASMGPW